MKNMAQILAGLLLTVLVVIFTLARLAFEIIGASTAPDDFALLQERMPAVTDWLFSTPWWVPTIMVIAMCGAGAWLIWSGTRRTAQDEFDGLGGGLTKVQVEQIVAERLAQQAAPAAVDLEEFLATRLRAEFMTQTQGHGTDIRINAAADKAVAANDKAESLARGIESLMTKLSGMERQWEDWTHNHCVNQDRRFRQLDYAFRAIFNRERMTELADEIDKEGVWLTRIVDGEAITDWNEWNARRMNWLSTIDSWVELASAYRSDINEGLKLVETEEINKGKWLEGDVDWPDFATMVDYRSACIILKRFRSKRGHAHLSVSTAAFQNPSMVGRGTTDD